MEEEFMDMQKIPADFLDESSEEDNLAFIDEVDILAEWIKTDLKDSFQLYLDEISSFPLLSAAEEVELAKRIEKGDQAAKQAFLLANLRLVVSVAKKYYKKSRMSIQDLVSEGNLGLMIAVNKFDFRKGCRFSTYATWYIRQSISRSIANQSRTIRLPVHLHESICKVKACRCKLLQEQGREATAAELADILGMKETEVQEALDAAMEPLSLDTPVKNDEDSCSLMNLTMDRRILDPGLSTFEHQRNLIIQEAMERSLTTREMDVLRWRYGMTDGDDWTLEKIGQELKLTRERIRQIEKKALRKLARSKALQELYKTCS